MTYTLFLDDERNPDSEDRVVARSFWDAVRTVEERGVPDHVEFDYHLNGPLNGFDFATWLAEHWFDGHGFPKTYSVHSNDPIGAKRIKDYIETFREKYNVDG